MKNVFSKCNIKDGCYLVKDYIERKYFTGLDIAEGFLIISDYPAYFIDARYFCAVEKAIRFLNIKPFLLNSFEDIIEYINKLNYKTVGINFDRTNVNDFKKLISLGFNVVNYQNNVDSLRAVKSLNELKNIKKACQIAQKAYYKTLPYITKGVSEKFIREKLEKFLLKFGAEDTSFETIVAFGKNSAIPHHITSEAILEENQTVLIDFGCKVNGYCSDCTRTAFYGTPNKKFIDCYNAVLEAQLEVEKKVDNHLLTNQVDSIARKTLKKYNIDNFFIHSLGHGLGLEIHEFPYLSQRKSDKLKNGMVFTNEPGVYFDNEFGIRIEDTVVLHSGKIKRLFTDSKELIIINNSLQKLF